MPYQDVLIDGMIAEKGDRECAVRYDAIAAYLRFYTRRFTVLDIGCAEGYFAFRLAQDFDMVYVGVDFVPDFGNLCRRNNPRRTIFLHRGLTPSELRVLGDCEHFDVTLALNVIHHYGPDWEEAAKAILSIGDDVFVESLALLDTRAYHCEFAGAILNFLWSQPQPGWFLSWFPSHTSSQPRPMWRFGRDKTSLRQGFLNPPERAAIEGMEIISGFHQKLLQYKGETRPWIHGINLWTYHNWLGQCGYPPRSYVVEKLKDFPLPKIRHGDIRPWNFIFDGEELFLIDGNDENANFDDREGLDETISILEKTP